MSIPSVRPASSNSQSESTSPAAKAVVKTPAPPHASEMHRAFSDLIGGSQIQAATKPPPATWESQEDINSREDMANLAFVWGCVLVTALLVSPLPVVPLGNLGRSLYSFFPE